MVYHRLGETYSRILVLGSRCQALSGIEKALLRSGPEIKVVGVSNPLLVEEIESGRPSAVMYELFGLSTLTGFAAALSLQAIVLACTHFTSLAPMIRAESPLRSCSAG